jgi:hypothetical protein
MRNLFAVLASAIHRVAMHRAAEFWGAQGVNVNPPPTVRRPKPPPPPPARKKKRNGKATRERRR